MQIIKKKSLQYKQILSSFKYLEKSYFQIFVL